MVGTRSGSLQIRQLKNVTLFISGGLLVIFIEYCFFPNMFRTLVNKPDVGMRHENWLNVQNNQSDSGKTKVYRFDGKQWLLLHEFCTWTVQVNCVMLKTTSGTTPIHIHDLKADIWVSGSIQKKGSWEQGNVNLTISELKKDPDLGFLDLGSHVGAFSLNVAKFGRKVVSVDPLIENVQRLCKSAQKGGFTDRMTIIFNPLSDKHTMVNFRREGNNVGGTSLISASRINRTKSPCDESSDSPTVVLDDLIPLMPFKKAVIKMDVQGHEYRVFKGGPRFFQQIHVAAILMEWDMMKTIADAENLVKLLQRYNFKAYDPSPSGRELDYKSYKRWPYDVLWRRS